MIPADGMKREIIRKFFHMAVVVAFIPIAALSKGIPVLIIVTGLVLYLLHESHVQKGGSVPFFTGMIRRVKRMEEKEISRAPFLMGIGIGVTVLGFSFRPAAAGLLQLAFCDMAAALVGMNWGRRKLPHSPDKSWEGSLAYFLTAIVLMPFLLYPWWVVPILALTGAFVESLPYKDWDNFLIPVVVAAVASFF